MAISGFPDILPKDQGLYHRWQRSIEGVFQGFGFSPMEEIVVESIKTLTAKGNDHEIYTLGRLHSHESKDLALRFDLTIPLARYISDYKGLINFPYGRYAMGPVFRGERPQEGRYRQFTQCDIDIVGQNSLSPFYDGYTLFTICSAFESLKLESVLGPTLCRVNHKKILDFWVYIAELDQEKAPLALRLIDKRGKVPWEDLRQDIIELGVSPEGQALLDKWIEGFPSWNEALTSLETLWKSKKQDNISSLGDIGDVIESLKATLGFVENLGYTSLVFDPLLARGLTYYSGITAEFSLPQYPQYGSIGAGGRYDNLVNTLENQQKPSKNQYPGVGFSIGLTRLFFIYLKELENQEKQDKNSYVDMVRPGKAQVLLAMEHMDSLAFFTKILKYYNQRDISAFLYLDNKSLSHQLRYGSKENIPWVLFANEEEMASGHFQLRFLPKGEQYFTTLEKSIDLIRGKTC